MNKRIALLVAGSAAVLATPALAQDSSPFTGPRAEVLMGYDISKLETDSLDIDDNFDRSIDGVTYGAGVGYDHAIGGLVVGIEGQIFGGEAKNTYDVSGISDFSTARISNGRDLYAGARVGALVTPNTLAYVKGGYTNAQYNVSGFTSAAQATDARVELDGWRVGGGLERAITNNVFVKGEYTYSDYGNGELKLGDQTSDSFDLNTHRHQVVVGAGFRF
ncbi:outer membrane beta-barrel protein [Altererythrobacter xixiisoli]|uniref:Outer membrane beta-barrel protein n=1 Tax=Croceibacterium xixiisoli TaxID=1476466 RepID=A0A6I4TSM3_9SPHN|nr:porin family protein [Croceibacterium xixiisoli]MXO98892.1 outer membrane beta-barrel protein [Croceibacterium xixiisoli]